MITVPTCENCLEPKGNTRTEQVADRPGWTCLACRWWNWLTLGASGTWRVMGRSGPLGRGLTYSGAEALARVSGGRMEREPETEAKP